MRISTRLLQVTTVYFISTYNVKSTAPAPPAPMSGFFSPTTSWWGQIMPAFLTAPRQLGHLPTTDYQLPPANCHLPTATCQLPPATCQLLPANCQIFFHQDFFSILFLTARFFVFVKNNFHNFVFPQEFVSASESLTMIVCNDYCNHRK